MESRKDLAYETSRVRESFIVATMNSQGEVAITKMEDIVGVTDTPTVDTPESKDTPIAQSSSDSNTAVIVVSVVVPVFVILVVVVIIIIIIIILRRRKKNPEEESEALYTEQVPPPPPRKAAHNEETQEKDVDMTTMPGGIEEHQQDPDTHQTEAPQNVEGSASVQEQPQQTQSEEPQQNQYDEQQQDLEQKENNATIPEAADESPIHNTITDDDL